MRRVWHYEKMDSWRGEIMELLRPQVTESVIAAFRRKPPKYVVSDDLSWLDSVIEKIHGYETDMKSNLAERLHEKFDAMRAYHGARPTNVQSYYEHGIRIMDPADIEQRARDVFLTGAFPELSADEIEGAIAAVPRDHRKREAYFEASKRELEDFCGHYMLYGSEFVTGVAAGLGCSSPDYRQVLKTIGTPTVFVCDVPLDLIPFPYLKDFAGSAIASIFESRRRRIHDRSGRSATTLVLALAPVDGRLGAVDGEDARAMPFSNLEASSPSSASR